MSSNKQMEPTETLGFKKILRVLSKLRVRAIVVMLWKDDDNNPEHQVQCNRQELDRVFTEMLVLARGRGVVDEDNIYFSFGQFTIGSEFSGPILYVFIHYEAGPLYAKRSDN